MENEKKTEQSCCYNETLSKEKLEELYKNVTMSSCAIDNILSYAKGDLFNVLKSQQEKYNDFAKQAENIAESLNFKMKDASSFAKGMADMGIKMKMAADNRNENIAKIMFLGSSNGIIDLCISLRHKTEGVRPEIIELIKTVLKFEEDKTELMKYYL